MNCHNAILYLEKYMKYFVHTKRKEISFMGKKISPEDASSSRGFLPIIFQRILNDAELCRYSMTPSIYDHIFGWTNQIMIIDNDNTIMGVMLSMHGNQKISTSKYMILSCCHKALEEIYDLFPSNKMDFELLCQGSKHYAEIHPVVK